MHGLAPIEPRPFLGYGLGLRPCYFDDLLKGEAAVDWLELLSENYMVPGGKPLHVLDAMAERYPLVLHGVSMSIGGTEPLDLAYLARLKTLAERARPRWISDHLCFTGAGGNNLHDLYPLPYTEEALRHVVARVRQVQDFLGRRILLENVSSYLSYRQSSMSEWQFLSAIAEEADCLLLLDINNVFVSAVNHGFKPEDFLHGLPPERVWQFHLAGHSEADGFLVDTHDQPVRAEVWDLYQTALRHFGAVSTMIERDDNFPEFAELAEELQTARRLGEAVLSREAA
ncbi:MAG: DUF692 domain-containing protein [Gammaproteobacteria bacterium]|nr:DUF692 domain-containing protein [Gammaproteobacteria bacterium]